jgi:hypothetical protein
LRAPTVFFASERGQGRAALFAARRSKPLTPREARTLGHGCARSNTARTTMTTTRLFHPLRWVRLMSEIWVNFRERQGGLAQDTRTPSVRVRPAGSTCPPTQRDSAGCTWRGTLLKPITHSGEHQCASPESVSCCGKGNRQATAVSGSDLGGAWRRTRLPWLSCWGVAIRSRALLRVHKLDTPHLGAAFT